MACKSTFVAGALLMLAAAASPASAVTVGPHSPVAEDSLVQLAQFPYCRAVRYECASRWGWGSRRYIFCVERRGCGVRY